jgi:hypothetical protein
MRPRFLNPPNYSANFFLKLINYWIIFSRPKMRGVRSSNQFSLSAACFACISFIVIHIGLRVSGSIIQSISRKISSFRNSRERDNADQCESSALQILYMDGEFCILNKPYDVRMDGEGFDVTVQSMVINHLHKLGFTNPTIRFAHRLDYATSGCLCVALSKKAAAQAGNLFISLSLLHLLTVRQATSSLPAPHRSSTSRSRTATSARRATSSTPPSLNTSQTPARNGCAPPAPTTRPATSAWSSARPPTQAAPPSPRLPPAAPPRSPPTR